MIAKDHLEKRQGASKISVEVSVDALTNPTVGVVDDGFPCPGSILLHA